MTALFVILVICLPLLIGWGLAWSPYRVKVQNERIERVPLISSDIEVVVKFKAGLLGYRYVAYVELFGREFPGTRSVAFDRDEAVRIAKVRFLEKRKGSSGSKPIPEDPDPEIVVKANRVREEDSSPFNAYVMRDGIVVPMTVVRCATEKEAKEEALSTYRRLYYGPGALYDWGTVKEIMGWTK